MIVSCLRRRAGALQRLPRETFHHLLSWGYGLRWSVWFMEMETIIERIWRPCGQPRNRC